MAVFAHDLLNTGDCEQVLEGNRSVMLNMEAAAIEFGRLPLIILYDSPKI